MKYASNARSIYIDFILGGTSCHIQAFGPFTFYVAFSESLQTIAASQPQCAQ